MLRFFMKNLWHGDRPNPRLALPEQWAFMGPPVLECQRTVLTRSTEFGIGVLPALSRFGTIGHDGGWYTTSCVATKWDFEQEENRGSRGWEPMGGDS